MLVLQVLEHPVVSGSPLDQGLLQFPSATPTRTPLPTPTRTPTTVSTPTPTSPNCPATAAVLLTVNRVVQGDSLGARGIGFMPGSSARVRVIDPDGVETVTQRTTSASCEVLVQITTSGADRP